MKRFLLFVLLLIHFMFDAQACILEIKYFYTTYMSNILENKDNSELCKSFMSGGLIEKMKRVSASTDCDAIIRAQDVNKNAIKTLKVKELGNDWYMVTYSLYDKIPEWYKGSTEPTCIPIKAVHKEGKCLIVYITPIWNNCMYGDELICNYNNCESVIDTSSAINFIKSFYNEYISSFYNMKENLETAVSSLRSEYLTQNGKSQFKSKRNIYLQDGYDGYDLLIDNFDFDYTWRNSIEINHIKDNMYEFSYTVAKYKVRIQITLSVTNGIYQIDSIARAM